VKTLEFLHTIGPFVSGVSLLIGAGAAWVTAFKFTRRSMETSWVEGFRRLYGDFWNDPDAASVRSWIASDTIYEEKLTPVLVRRMEHWKDKKNLLNQEEYAVIEKLDNFLHCLFEWNSLINQE
jgi:hypothetical protein